MKSLAISMIILNYITNYDQETSLTIERAKGQKWSDWFKEE